MARRVALLVASYDYQDAGLRRLEAPQHDAEALADVLGDPDIAGFDVTVLVNEPHYVVGEAIGDFYGDRRRDDLTLLYFTGHGLKDDQSRLYLAMTNTKREKLSWTALPAELINDAMEACRSGQKVLVLDCCYSGAFPSGRAAKADPAVHTLETFRGKGRAVLTASDATQYSFEGEHLTGGGSRSVFTRCLVEGLRTGKADLDGDGDISLDDLYSYVHDRVVEEMPQQRPKKQENIEGRIVVARNIHWQLPGYLSNAIGSPISKDRVSGLDGLHHLHRIGNDLVRTIVLDHVRRLTDDDSKAVSTAATALLTELIPELARLAGHYDQGCAAADAGRWDEAIEHFTEVTATDPGYRDAAARLEQAQAERSLAGLRTELADLARAQRWGDVLTIWDRIQKIQPDADDPDGRVSTAREQLARQQEAERAEAERRQREAERAESARQQQIAEQQARLHRLAEAHNWSEVLAVSEELAGLDLAAADVDGLVDTAREELARQQLQMQEGEASSTKKSTPCEEVSAREQTFAENPVTINQSVRQGLETRESRTEGSAPGISYDAKVGTTKWFARRSWITLVTVGIAIALPAALLLATWSRGHYAVGVKDGKVVVFQGVSARPLGVDLQSVSATDVSIELLRVAEQERVRQRMSFRDRRSANLFVDALREEAKQCASSLRLPCPPRTPVIADVRAQVSTYPRGNFVTITWGQPDQRAGATTSLKVNGGAPSTGCPAIIKTAGHCSFRGSWARTYIVGAVVNAPGQTPARGAQTKVVTYPGPSLSVAPGPKFVDAGQRYCTVLVSATGLAPNRTYKVTYDTSWHHWYGKSPETLALWAATDARGNVRNAESGYGYKDPDATGWVQISLDKLTARRSPWACS